VESDASFTKSNNKIFERFTYIILCFCIAGYILFFGQITIFRYNRLGTTIFDLGIFDQAVWLIAHGRPIFLSTRGLTIFADHFSPILYLIAPLYWIWDTPKTLLVLQTLACAMGAHPVYLYAVKRLKDSRLGLLFAAAYLLYPALQGLNCFDFHPESIAVPLILYGWWFMETRQIKPLIPVIILALMCKETVGLVVLLMGIYAFFTINRRIGVIVTALGLAGLIISLETIRFANHGEPSAYLTFYSAYGSSPGAIAINLLTHPMKIWNALLTADNYQCLRDLLSPLAFLSFASPETLAIAGPTILSNMLSNRESMHNIYFQYSAMIIPIVFISAILGYHFCLQLFSKRNMTVKRIWRMTLAFALSIGVAYGVQEDQIIGNPMITWLPERTYDTSALRESLALIPPCASVCSQTAIGSHLTHREHIYIFPGPFEPVCWGNTEKALNQEDGRDITLKSIHEYRERMKRISVDFIVLGPMDSSYFPLLEDDYQFFLRLFLTDPHYGVISANQIIILKHGADHKSGLRMLAKSNFNDPLRVLYRYKYNTMENDR
jgi:uncharacterized membrane protein